MNNEIQIVNDGEGLALIGEPNIIERLLVAHDLPSQDLGLPKLGSLLNVTSGVTQAGAEIAASSGRWIKLTEQSAQALKQGTAMKGSTAEVSRAVVTSNGKITNLLEFSKAGSLLTNPAILTGAAGLMAQVAMQQAMNEITDYLATIDAKVDSVLRSQKDAVLSDMIGVGLVIDEALTIRSQVGRVSQVTWSKVQSTSATIARTQAYALRQLDGHAESLEKARGVGELATASKDTASTVNEWLAVLARCFQLQDATAVLELDRVFDTAPDELESHRLAVRAARQQRLELIARSTEQLVERMNSAVGTANAKVLLNPRNSRTVVTSSNHVTSAVAHLHTHLGLDRSYEALEERRWVEAATEVRDKALETGSDGLNSAKRFGDETFVRAKTVTGRASDEIRARASRRRNEDR